MRRLTRGRAATDDEATPQASAASEPVSATPDAQQGGLGLPANGVAAAPAPEPGDEPKTAVLAEGDGAAKPGDEPRTAVLTGPGSGDDARDLPAGVDPAALAALPSSARRGKLRRRLRYLRAVREILLRDIGGFYYEAQRTDEGVESHRRLLDAKSGRLARLDEEVRELESRLDETRPETVLLRQPGLGGTCPECGELHGSDARFCWRCGAPLGGRGHRAATAAPKPAVAPAADEGSKATTASLWGRPKRPEPPIATPAPDAGAAFAAPGGPSKPAPPPPGTVESEQRDDHPAVASEQGGDQARIAPEQRGDRAATAPERSGDEPATETAAAQGDGAAAPTPAGDEPAPTGSERS